MKDLVDNRNWFVTMLLTFFTLGIYGIYLTHVMARDTNVACDGDGKHTSGVWFYILLTVVTLGIYSIIWEVKILGRWANNAEANRERPKCSILAYILLNYVLVCTFICPMIYSYKRLQGFNQTCQIYNDHSRQAEGIRFTI